MEHLCPAVTCACLKLPKAFTHGTRPVHVFIEGEYRHQIAVCAGGLEAFNHWPDTVVNRDGANACGCLRVINLNGVFRDIAHLDSA